MSKLKGKLARRIMAIVLSGAMVMSNMSAYAAEISTEAETEIVTEVEETAAAETTEDTAGEEAAENSNDEKSEAESSVAESSESKDDEAKTEDATEAETENASETDTEAEESTVSETETTEVGTTEEEITEVETTEEETTEIEVTEEEATEVETTEEVNKEGEIDKTTSGLSVDLSEGLDANTLYGNKEILTFTAFEKMELKDSDKSQKIDGVDYNGFVQGTNNPKPNAGQIPTGGAFLKITAADTDSTLSLVLKEAKDSKTEAPRTYHFIKVDVGTDGTESVVAGSDQSGTTDEAKTVKFNLEANSTYYFYLDGSKACIYGISYAKGTSGSGNEGGEATEAAKYILETKDLTAFGSDTKTDGDTEKAGTNDYFTLIYSKGTKVDSSSKTWDDGYASGQRVNFGGTASIEKNSIKFTTSAPAAVTVWWAQGGDDNRQIVILNSSGTEVDRSKETLAKNAVGRSKFTLDAAGTYYLGSVIGNNYIFKVEVEETAGTAATTTTFDAKAIFKETIAQGSMEGKAVSYVNDYFTVFYGSGSSVDSHKQTFEDEYESAYRMNFRGVVSTTSNAIKFTAKQNEVTVSVWWRPNAADRHIQILDKDGTAVATSPDRNSGTNNIEKFELNSAGTYYVGGDSASNIYIYKVVVVDGHVEEAVDWSKVPTPVITDAKQATDSNGALTGNIDVTVQAIIHELNGCESVTVEMYDSADATEPVSTASSRKETDSSVTVTLTPEKSGSYWFVAKASRENEEDKISERYAMATPFSLPLSKPSITRATNDGEGGVEIAYNETAEAEKYVATAVKVTKNDDGTYTPVEGAAPVYAESIVTSENAATTAKFEGLEIGQYYAYTVHAVRGEDTSAESDAFYKIVKNEKEQVWDYSSFGESTSTNTEQCGYSGDVNDGEVSVWSLGGKGKIVPASTDGVSFLYTKINKDTNFVLEATAYVDEWTYSNGQEGFGIMVADTVGPHGHGTKFWNNSFMAVATKMEYYWNGSTVLSADAGPADDRVRYNMYLGLGSIARTGVTDEWDS